MKPYLDETESYEDHYYAVKLFDTPQKRIFKLLDGQGFYHNTTVKTKYSLKEHFENGTILIITASIVQNRGTVTFLESHDSPDTVTVIQEEKANKLIKSKRLGLYYAARSILNDELISLDEAEEMFNEALTIREPTYTPPYNPSLEEIVYRLHTEFENFSSLVYECLPKQPEWSMVNDLTEQIKIHYYLIHKLEEKLNLQISSENSKNKKH